MMMVLAFAVVMLAPAVAREFAAMRRSFNGYLMPSIASERLPWVLSLGLVAFLYGAWTITHYGFNDNAVGTDVISRLPLSAILGAFFVAFFVVAYRRGMRGGDDGAQVLLVLLAISGLLLYVAELFRLHDFFGSRHNTVFKFYYQVWIFLAVGGGYSVYLWMRRHPTFTGRSWILSSIGVFVAVLLILVSLYYPFAATAGKSSESSTEFTLDGLAFIEKTQALRFRKHWNGSGTNVRQWRCDR